MHQVGATPDRSLSELSVCVVGINYAPDTTGIAPYTTALASALHTAGAAVHVITGIPHYPQLVFADGGYAARLAEPRPRPPGLVYCLTLPPARLPGPSHVATAATSALGPEVGITGIVPIST